VSVQYYCYGRGGEYSLEPIELALREMGRNVVCAKNMSAEELKLNLDQSIVSEKVLISSAHPGINSLTGRQNLSIAELRRIYDWKSVAFFPHDLSEPFRWEERIYLNDYDFFISEFNTPYWIKAYIPVVKIKGLSRRKKILGMNQDFLFLPDNFWSFGIQKPSLFIKRFPFVLQKNLVTKFVNVPEAYEFTKLLRHEYDLNILSPSIPGFEIITPENGVLLTQGPSGVLSEAFVSKMDAIYVNEVPLSDWMKQALVNRFPSIVDFYSVEDGDLVKRTQAHSIRQANQAVFSISELLTACEG